MNKIIESCKFVVDHSSHVRINDEKINEFCDYFDHKHIKHWINEAPFNFSELSDGDKLRFFLVFNAMSFSYWGDPKWEIQYRSQKVDGAYGMISCIARAIEEGFSILDAKYLSELTAEDLSVILRGNVEIPMFEQRLAILREVGTVLVENFDGDFANLVRRANNDASRLVELIVENFASFSDASEYRDRVIHFNKRAQLLVADISQIFQDGEFMIYKNVDQLTACADYKLPLILRRLGILLYSNELASKIDNRIQIEQGSEEEVELRANTIWVVDRITSIIKSKIKDVNAIHVNDHIWMLSQDKIVNEKPYHLTRTTAY